MKKTRNEEDDEDEENQENEDVNANFKTFFTKFKDKTTEFWRKNKKKTVIGASIVVSTAVGAVAAPLVLAGVGFTATGVAAGSIAAAIQSSIGSVVAGSAFATAQSLAATGAITSVGAVAGATTGGVASTIAVFSKK